MSTMKRAFDRKVNEALETISNSMDGEYEVYLVDLLDRIGGKISEACEMYHLFSRVMYEAKQDNPDIMEKCLELDSQFEMTYESIDDLLD